MSTLPRAFAVAGISLIPTTATAQQDSLRQQADSLRRFSLGEIVVSAPVGASSVVSTTTFSQARIDATTIQRADAAVVADFGRLVPAAHVQTNSRGETLVYLRNAGERQVAVFFEGALLNIPWDNRVDLGMVPAGAVGGISVAKGVPPVEYGSNVLGGAMNLTARTAEGPWSETEISARYGSANRTLGTMTHRSRAGRFSYTASAAFTRVDGMPVSSDADLPFSQPAAELRTNTDSRVTNVFAHGEYDFDTGARVGVSVMHVDARRGVAPEGHLDPVESRVRFWRYPSWHNTTAIVSADAGSGSAHWKGAAWVTRFDQAIESYGSAAYSRVEERQEDDDLTVGARLTLSHVVGPGVLKLAFNGLTSEHRQRDLTLDASGQVEPGAPRLAFQQHLLSLGSELAVSPTRDVNLALGLGIDAMVLPKTGDKPDRDPFADYTATVGLAYRPPAAWFLRSSIGRKTRFPTMREMFGESLDRFLLNPDLRPESSWTAEFAVGVTGPRLSAEFIPFVSLTDGTIDQISVPLPGDNPPRRQRVNLDGSRIIGVEIVGMANPAPRVMVEGHLTVMNARRTGAAAGEPTRLSEKPAVIGRLGTEYADAGGFSTLVETVYTGRAWSPDENNVFQPLPTSLVLNVRVGQQFLLGTAETVEIFGRVDNLTDELVLPQLGLPDAGRTLSGGMRVAF